MFMPEKCWKIDWWQILYTLTDFYVVLNIRLCSYAHTSPLNEAAQMDPGDESSVTTPESLICAFSKF